MCRDPALIARDAGIEGREALHGVVNHDDPSYKNIGPDLFNNLEH
ncbi:hypothetical protein [Dyella sp. 2RAB6]